MQLRYLSEDAYDRLYGSIERNLKWYNSSSTFVEYIGLSDEDYGASTINQQHFNLVPVDENASDDEKNDNDLINIRIVYGTWAGLTRLQASNRYLWTYYCHCDAGLVSYIRSRWMAGSFSESQVKNVFFVTSNKRNLVRGNALSSLWWKGYLTYDEESSDPFWITRMLGSTTNLADFLDTFNSYSQTRTRGIARAIAEVIDELKLDRLRNQPFRDLNKVLNHHSVVSPLDFFTEEDMYELAKKEFIRICKH